LTDPELRHLPAEDRIDYRQRLVLLDIDKHTSLARKELTEFLAKAPERHKDLLLRWTSAFLAGLDLDLSGKAIEPVGWLWVYRYFISHEIHEVIERFDGKKLVSLRFLVSLHQSVAALIYPTSSQIVGQSFVSSIRSIAPSIAPEYTAARCLDRIREKTKVSTASACLRATHSADGGSM
jgi:hypothetical protein